MAGMQFFLLGARRSGPRAAGKGCVLPGALGWGPVGRLGQLVEGLECQAKQMQLCFAGQTLGHLLCACRTVELLRTVCRALLDPCRGWAPDRTVALPFHGELPALDLCLKHNSSCVLSTLS